MCFYEADIKNGVITREQAKEYLQELFLMLQAATPITSAYFTRGAESHFCIGGYLPDGSDGFCDLSKLILESLLELPTWIPQVTLRWTEKTPKENHLWACVIYFLRYFAVIVVPFSNISSGVPVNTTSPPFVPPSGPMSMI